MPIKRFSAWGKIRLVENEAGEVTVSLETDGTVGISLSPTERPVKLLRKAAAVLEAYAGSIEREQEPIACETCGVSPSGARATPDGQWEFTPCGHGLSGLG